MDMFFAALLGIIVLLVLDGIYLSIMSKFYERSIQHLQCGEKMTVQLIPTIACYVFMVLGFVIIVIAQLERHGTLHFLSLGSRLKYAIRTGGILGLIVYGVFNTTNLAIFKHYNKTLAIIDIMWGTVLYTIATFAYLTLR